MPKSDHQKLKILYVWDYLKKNSGEEHPVSAAELIGFLSDLGISAERRTIYSDIMTLQEFGVDIITVSGRGGGYYIASQDFEPSELKLLVDQVASSRFLTEKKSAQLIGKLCKLCNETDAKLIARNVYVSNRVKSMNESILYNMDTIQEAIYQGKQIKFRYFDWDIQGQRVYRPQSYKVSPYALVHESENCYLVAISPKRVHPSHYRVDRMSDIEILPVPRVYCKELTGPALNQYTSKLFHMFSGKLTRVKLRFHNSLVNPVFDYFGRDTMLHADGEEYFLCTAEVEVSSTFFGWLAQFQDKAQILYPKSTITEYLNFCTNLTKPYQS